MKKIYYLFLLITTLLFTTSWKSMDGHACSSDDDCNEDIYSSKEYNCVKDKCKLHIECSKAKDCKSGEICIENICLENVINGNDKIIISTKKDTLLSIKEEKFETSPNIMDEFLYSKKLHLRNKKIPDIVTFKTQPGMLEYFTISVKHSRFETSFKEEDYVDIVGICKNKKTGLDVLMFSRQSTGSLNAGSLYFLYYDKKKKEINYDYIVTSGDIIESLFRHGLLIKKDNTIYCNDWKKRMKEEKMIAKVMRAISITTELFTRYTNPKRPYFELIEDEDDKKPGIYPLENKRTINCNLYKRLLRNKWVFRRNLLNNENWDVKFIYYNAIESSPKHTGAIIVYDKKKHSCQNIYQYKFTEYDDYIKDVYYSPKFKSKHLTYIKSNPKDNNIKNYLLIKLSKSGDSYYDFLFHLSENSIKFYKE